MDPIALREIEQPTEREVDELADLLIAVVEQGASVGFLAPLDRQTAAGYWRDVAAPHVVLLVAERDSHIVGTAQLHLATSPNGRHRAEVAKVVVHPSSQRQGIGRRLLHKLETIAERHGRTLLVLDTRTGDASNDLYRSLGYNEAGRIPGYARSSNGDLDDTIFYYKLLGGAAGRMEAPFA